MAKYRVKTPNPAFAGVRYGVQFYKGEAIAELSDNAVKELESWGYSVEKIEEKKAPAKKTTTRKTTQKKTSTK